MQNILVSIIIPIYNVEQYIADCLHSVASQTMQDDVECILVDDCGNDNSMDIVGKFVDDYQGPMKFSIIHHNQNKGLSAARNTGINVAKGKYVYFLDSDDTITKDCISSLWGLVEKYPNIECVFAGANVSKQNCFLWMDYTKKDLPEYSSDKEWLQESILARYTFSMTAWNKLINLQFLKNNNLYFEEGFVHEDEIWNLQLSQCLSGAAFLKKNTYNYSVRDNSIITSAESVNELFLQRHFRLWNKMLDLIKTPNASTQAYYVFSFTYLAYSRITSFSEWKDLLKISRRAFAVANGKKKIAIFKMFIVWNLNWFLFKNQKTK